MWCSVVAFCFNCICFFVFFVFFLFFFKEGGDCVFGVWSTWNGFIAR